MSAALANPRMLPRMGSRTPASDAAAACHVLCLPSDHPLSQGSIPQPDYLIGDPACRHHRGSITPVVQSCSHNWPWFGSPNTLLFMDPMSNLGCSARRGPSARR